MDSGGLLELVACRLEADLGTLRRHQRPRDRTEADHGPANHHHNHHCGMADFDRGERVLVVRRPAVEATRGQRAARKRSKEAGERKERVEGQERG